MEKHNSTWILTLKEGEVKLYPFLNPKKKKEKGDKKNER
jgi:hypothetical protein